MITAGSNTVCSTGDQWTDSIVFPCGESKPTVGHVLPGNSAHSTDMLLWFVFLLDILCA